MLFVRLGLLLFALCVSLALRAQTVSSALLEASFRQELAAGIGVRLNPGRIASLAGAQRAANQFSTYILERTGRQLPAPLVQQLADAEWRARSRGEPNLAVIAVAQTATGLFLEKLGGPGTRAPITAGNTPYYVITPEKLNGARLLYRRHAPAVVVSDLPEQVGELHPARSTIVSVQKAYPIEALVALYLCISEDVGRPEARLRAERLGRETGSVIPPNRRPYGELGYFVTRPISRLFADDVLSAILALAQ